MILIIVTFFLNRFKKCMYVITIHFLLQVIDLYYQTIISTNIYLFSCTP